MPAGKATKAAIRKKTRQRFRIAAAHSRQHSLALLAVAALLAFFLAPELKQGLAPLAAPRPTAITDDELRRAVALLRAAPPPPPTPQVRAMAALGRRLFFDARLSANGQVSCGSCHAPEKYFSDGLAVSAGISPTQKNAPTILNAYLNDWFFWDGRADSLAAQALQPVEDPREHGISRVFVVRHLLEHYESEYSTAFGPFPAGLSLQNLPKHGMPKPAPVQLATKVAAYSLATLGSVALLDDILTAAQKSRHAPYLELTHRALSTTPSPETSWFTLYEGLSDAQKEAVDVVFFNFGRAVAAYEEGLVAISSPFDAFAQHFVEGGQSAEGSLVSGFGAQELTGLRLFAGRGNCTLCHTGPNFSDQQFHNIGLPQLDEHLDADLDLGRATGVHKALINTFNCQSQVAQSDAAAATRESCRELPYLDTDNFELVGAHKTPSLRNVSRTAPYMHDGRFVSLREVLAHYNRADEKAAVGHREESLKPLGFTDAELEALEDFLKALDSPVSDVNL